MSHPPGTILDRLGTSHKERGRPLSPTPDTHALTRPRPYQSQSDTLRHLACLIDRSLDDIGLLDPHGITARHLGCGADEVAESTIDTTRFRFRLTGLALATFLEEHPDAELSAALPGERPRWEILSLGDRHLPHPTSVCAFFPPGTAAPFGFSIVAAVDRTWNRNTLAVIARPEDLGAARAVLLDIDRRGTTTDNPLRGMTLEARLSAREALELDTADLVDQTRADLVLPDGVWAALDLNVHRHLGAIPTLQRAGLGANRGLLLAGPPGTGKTAACRVLAAELAGRATVLFADARTMHEALPVLYRHAEFLAPSVVVLEDVDLVVRDRRGSEPNRALVEFLTALDGALTAQAGVVTIATTNDPRGIDPAARRAARIDAIIEVPEPDARARAAILRRFLEPLGIDLADVPRLVATTAGASGADLRELARRGVLEHGDDLRVDHLDVLARGGSWRAQPSTGVYL